MDGQRLLANYPWWTSFWLLTLLPSEDLKERKTPLERMVRRPRRRRAVNHLGRVGGSRLGTNTAVVSPAVATPKLMESCCTVLARELPLLV